jgi:hypothetical protein
MAHLHLTCGTWWLACHLTLAIRHKVYTRSFYIPPVGPDGLRVTCTYGTFLHLHPTCGTQRFVCHLYHVYRRALISQKKVWYLGVGPGIWTKKWSVFTITLDAWLCWHLFGVAIVSYWLCGCPIGWPKLDIPCKWKQICARRTCDGGDGGAGGGSPAAVVAQASFWWHGGTLLMERGGIGVRVIRCVPRQRRLAAEPCQFI